MERRICVYCGERATCIDHIHPKSRGGLDIESNRVPCCQICNSSKSNRLLTEWSISKVLYAVTQDDRIFMELLTITETIIVTGIELTLIDKVRIASRILNNRNYRILRDITSKIEIPKPDMPVIAKGYITLREYCDLRQTISLQAIKRARSRDKEKSFPIGKSTPRGIIYNPSDIDKWIDSRPYGRKY